ncbi:uncharacterized protein LOC6587888 [Drosophila persimilis]|uniref:uncharacterized protein LOC6587888 n=1 Tax=Drosophila persimilis TaxID=7234 RepID=UPI000F084927|nr:uncharacterized protein LOC6587888 [Drosophila persimilis]
MFPANGDSSNQNQLKRKMSIPNITIIPRKGSEEMRFLPIAAMPTKSSSITMGHVQSIKNNNNNNNKNIHSALKSKLTMTPMNMNIVQSSGVKTTSIKPGGVSAGGPLIQLVPMSAVSATGGATNHHPSSSLMAILTPSVKTAMKGAAPPHAHPHPHPQAQAVVIRPTPASMTSVSKVPNPSKASFTINSSSGSTTVTASAISSGYRTANTEYPNTTTAKTAGPPAPVPASVSVSASGSASASATAAVALPVPAPVTAPSQQQISLIGGGGQSSKQRSPFMLSKVAVDKLRFKFNQAGANPNAIIVSKAIQQGSSAQAICKNNLNPNPTPSPIPSPSPSPVSDMPRVTPQAATVEKQIRSNGNCNSSNNSFIYPKTALPLPPAKDTPTPGHSIPTTATGSNNNKERDIKKKALPIVIGSTPKDMPKAPPPSRKMSPSPNPREITIQAVGNGPLNTESKPPTPQPPAPAKNPPKVKRSKSFVSLKEVAMMPTVDRRRASVVVGLTKEHQAPAKQPQARATEPQVAAKEPQAPAKEPQAPAKEPQVPAKEPQAPAKEHQVPAKEPQVHAKEPQAPSKQPQLHAKEPQAPAKEAQVAAKKLQAPAKEAQVAAKEPVVPAKDTVEPDKEDDAVVILADPPIETITIDTDDSDDDGEKEQAIKAPLILSTDALTVTAIPASPRRTSTSTSSSTSSTCSSNHSASKRKSSTTGVALGILENSRKKSRKNSSTSASGITLSSSRKSSHGSISISSSSSSANSDVEEVSVPAKKRKEDSETRTNMNTHAHTISIVKAESVSNEDFERSLRCEETLAKSPDGSVPSSSSGSNGSQGPPPLPRPTQNGEHPPTHKTPLELVLNPPYGSRSALMKKAMLNHMHMLRWRGQQPGSLHNSSLRFDINRYSLLQLNERCEPRKGPASYFERAIFDRPDRRPTDSLHPLLYLCQRCNCHGPAADFLAPHYCSVGCVRRSQKRRFPGTNIAHSKAKKAPTQQQRAIRLEHQMERAREKVAKRPFRWTEYMETHGPELTAPIHLFLNPFPRNANCFERGMKLEAIDPENCSLFCVCTVAEVRGYRLKLSFDGYSSMYDFWVNADSLDIFPPGWCESTNRILQAPRGYCSQRWNWSRYLVKTNAKAAPRVLFTHLNHTPYKRENRFRRGMHLEAEDLNDTGKICVATVADILDERIRVHFNGWDDCYDFWVHISSPYIHPCGWHAGRQQLIVPPSYHNTVFSWEDFMRRKGGIAAPEDLFSPRQPMDFQARMKLEVVDQRNPCLIRPATVVVRKGFRVQLHLDCWPSEYYFWLEDDSTDLHPIGWCEATQHELEAPPGFLQAPPQMPCDVNGCRGFGNAKRFNLNVHALPECCPYAPENWRQWRSKTVKPARVAPHEITRAPLREPMKFSVATPLPAYRDGFMREQPVLVIDEQEEEEDDDQIVIDEVQMVINEERIEEVRPQVVVQLEPKIEPKQGTQPKRRDTIPRSKTEIKGEHKVIKEEPRPKQRERILKRQDETTAKIKETMPKQKETTAKHRETIPKAKEVKYTLKETKPTPKETKILSKDPKPTRKETKPPPKDTKPNPKEKKAKPTPKETEAKSTTNGRESKGSTNHKVQVEEPVDPRCITIAMPIVKDYGPQFVRNYRLWQKNSAFALSKIQSNPLYWTNWDVYEYVERALNSPSIAQTIFDQDIDGRALLMLGREDMSDHLLLKKGPAVKLYSHIVNLRIAVVCKFNMNCTGMDIGNFEAVDAKNERVEPKQKPIEKQPQKEKQPQQKNPQQNISSSSSSSSSSFDLEEQSSDNDFDEDDNDDEDEDDDDCGEEEEEEVVEDIEVVRDSLNKLKEEHHHVTADEEDDELDNEDFQSINPSSLTHDDNDDDSDLVMLPPLKARHCMSTAS